MFYSWVIEQFVPHITSNIQRCPKLSCLNALRRDGIWAGRSLAQFVKLCQQTIIWVSVLCICLLNFYNFFVKFYTICLHISSQFVSSKRLNFVFRTTSLVNAPFREMFCKHFKTHINRGERQKLKTLLFQNQIFISKKSLIPKQSFDVMFQEVMGVAILWLRFLRLISPHTHFSNKSFVMRFVKQTNCSRTILLFIPSPGVHLWDALSEWSPLPAKKLTTETHL